MPAQLNKLDSLRAAVAQSEARVGHCNVSGWWADRSFLSEKGIAFGLDDLRARNICGHWIGAHDQTAVTPRVAGTVVVGPCAVEEWRQHHQDIEARLALHVGHLPDRAQSLTGVRMVCKRGPDEHDVIFDESTEA